MKKILTLAAVMVFATSAAFAADLPYEMDPGHGGGGSDDTPPDVALSNSAGRDLPYENGGGTDDPDDDDSDVSLAIGRILSLIGIIR